MKLTRTNIAIPSDSISRIAEASDGHLLVLSQGGFLEFDGHKVIKHPEVAARFGVRDEKIFDVFQDPSGTMWYGTGAGIRREGEHPFAPLRPRVLAQYPAYRTYQDPQGSIWIATGTGTYRVTGDHLDELASGVGARCLYADRNGELWMGTNGVGPVHFKPRLVRMYTKADGLPVNIAMAVLPAHDGKLWIGCNWGLSVFDRGHFKNFTEKDGLANTVTGDIQAFRAFKEGAVGFLLKDTLRAELVSTIRLIHGGGRRIPLVIAQNMAEHVGDDVLSVRELDVLEQISQGRSNKIIASQLDITENTVKNHIKSILTKLDADDRTHAVTIALKRGYIES